MEFFSPGHLIVLAIIVVVLFFGWKQLPDMARSAGRSMRVFRTELKGMTDDDAARDANRAATVATPPASTQAAVPIVQPTVPPPAAAPASDIPAADGPAKAAG